MRGWINRGDDGTISLHGVSRRLKLGSSQCFPEGLKRECRKTMREMKSQIIEENYQRLQFIPSPLSRCRHAGCMRPLSHSSLGIENFTLSNYDEPGDGIIMIITQWLSIFRAYRLIRVNVVALVFDYLSD